MGSRRRRPGRRRPPRRLPRHDRDHSRRRRHRPASPCRARPCDRRPPARPADEQRQSSRAEPTAAAGDVRPRGASARLRDQRGRTARARPAAAPRAARGDGSDDRQRHVRRIRGGVRRLGRLWQQQGRTRPAVRHPCGGAPGPSRLCVRPRRHAHRHAPGGVPRGGHHCPTGTRDRRSRAARAGRPAATERPRPRRRPAGPGQGMLTMTATPLDFELPPSREATMPPEARGIRRDHVRLLVATDDNLTHTRFTHLAEHLHPGDVVVVNDSATLAAAVDGQRDDETPVTVHFSGPLAGDDDYPVWVVELRPGARARGPLTDAVAGEQLTLPAGARITLLGSYPDGGRTSGRLWAAHIDTNPSDVTSFLGAQGRPITYAYVDRPWPLDAYQTVFARSPGSAEMPSAARPFTTRVVTDLVARGIAVAPVTLHTGVSSPEAGEPPIAERYAVPAATADLVNLTARRGGRVVAVGTTVTRALETVASRDGIVRPGHGVTDLVLGPDRPPRVVSGLVTGWHAPGASHLSLLQSVGGAELVRTAYDAAVAQGYLWHEFGDSCLLLP